MQTDRYARSPMDKPRERSIGMSMGVRARARVHPRPSICARESLFMTGPREEIVSRRLRRYSAPSCADICAAARYGFVPHAPCAFLFANRLPRSRALSLSRASYTRRLFSLSPLVCASTYRGYLFIYVAQVFGTARALPASNRLLMDGDRRTRRAVI